MPIFGKDDGGSVFQYGISTGHHYHVTYHEGADVPPVVGTGSATGLRSHKVAVFENEQQTGGYPYTDAEVRTFGQAFDFISSQVTTPRWTSHYTSAQIALMRAANSGLKLVIYTNSGEDTNPTGTTYPDAYYAHDATGSKIVNSRWHTWAMQPDNPDWMSTIIALGQARRATVDVNGVSVPYNDGEFADVLGDAPTGYKDPSGVATPPVNPVTGAKYSSAQWYAMTSALAVATKAASPGKYLVVNGIASGQKYFSASRKLLSVPNGPDSALCEGFVRIATASTDISDGDGYPPSQINPGTGKPGTATATATSGAASWKACINMILDANGPTINKPIFCTTKDWTTSPNATARMQFGFATFLLADNGLNYFCASPSQVATMTPLPWLSYTDYGTALGPYTTDANGCYYRSFSKCSIGVNPTTASHTMTVGGQTQTVAPYRAAFVFL